jgi:hypothetical protein
MGYSKTKMIYTYYNKEIRKGATSTNIAGLSRASGLKYHVLLGMFKNGEDVYDTESYLIMRTELIKGKQRVTKQSSTVDSPPDETGSFMDELLK